MAKVVDYVWNYLADKKENEHSDMENENDFSMMTATILDDEDLDDCLNSYDDEDCDDDEEEDEEDDYYYDEEDEE